MSGRQENREWLETQAQLYPHGWEDWQIKRYGIEGALDVLDATAVGVASIDLRRKPWAGDERLKALVREARAAEYDLARAVYERLWADDKLEGGAS